MKKRTLFILIESFLFLLKISSIHGQSEAEHADKNRDPFHLPPKKFINHSAPVSVQVDQWRLTGILVGMSGEKSAILNNRIVSEGDKVMGGTVYSIGEDRVILKGSFGTKELRILPFLSESQ